MGRPKFQSDVFSVGLVLYRLFSGKLPEWPFKWPMAGNERLRARVRPELEELLRKAIQLDPADRYRNATEMYAAFAKLQSHARRQRKGRIRNDGRKSAKPSSSWRQLQWREFRRQFNSALDTRHQCRRCGGFGVLLNTTQDPDDHTLVQRSQRLLMEEVGPKVESLT